MQLRTREKRFHESSIYLTAIACVFEAGRDSFKKYHNIMNTETAKARFQKFILSKFPSVKHVNYYFSNGMKAGQVRVKDF